MDIREKTINSKQIYDGKIIKVTLDTVICPNGMQAERELVRHRVIRFSSRLVRSLTAVPTYATG